MEKQPKIKNSYYCTFLVIYKCYHFNKHLIQNHHSLINTFDENYKVRVINSAVRCTSLMYVISKVLNIPFDMDRCLITGMCAAIFDDMIDEGHESIAAIEKFVEHRDSFRLESELGKSFQVLYSKLMEQSSEWQNEQLIKNILSLLAAERISLSGEDAQCEERGTASFKIFTAILGVRDAELKLEVALKFGKYLQALDDYEDIDIDNNEINIFKSEDDFDISRYYVEDLKPILPKLFSRNTYDYKQLFKFLETYHVYALAINQQKHKTAGPISKLRLDLMRNFLSLFSRHIPF